MIEKYLQFAVDLRRITRGAKAAPHFFDQP
jgi:hypothetical protein